MDCVTLIGNKNVGDKGIKCDRKNVFSYPAHNHTHYELTLYNPFDGQITINGVPFFVTSPTAVLMTPYYTHKIEIKGNFSAEYTKITFNGNIFGKKGMLPEYPLALKNIDNGFVKASFSEIFNRKNDTATIKPILTALLTVMKKDGERIFNEQGKKSSPYTSKVTDFINEHYRESITLTQIADIVGLTPQYLSFLFKSEMKIGIKEYLSRSRLLCAEEMLKNTKMPVSEICYFCGFSNFSHFLRTFRKYYGASPKEYRKNHL